MKFSRFAPLVTTMCGSAALLPATAGAATYAITNGIYDPGTADGNQANAVDTDATGTLAAFKTSTLAAYTAGFGGVAHFDVAQGTTDSSLNFTYGPSNSKTLLVTSTNTHVVVGVSSSTSSVFGISGANVSAGTAGVGALNTTGVSSVTFSMGAITGGALNEGVTSFGFTILSRTNYGVNGNDFTATAFFSDGTNSGGVTSNIGSTLQTDDTFWSFTAPTGYSITSIAITATGGNQPVFDDFGIITTAGVVIPEPSAALLIGAGAGLATLRRRRA